MTSRDAQLAVLLRQAQWLLDATAHDLPAGRCTKDDREALASTLDELAEALRGRELAPSVVDGQQIEQ